MRKVTAYNFISLNGFFKGLNEDISWHQHREEEAKYSEESLAADNILLFGRKTYEMMASFWPTPMAAELFPKVAEGMNRAEKIVFSNTITDALWTGTQIVSGNIIEYVRKLKSTRGKNMTILGSGTIISLLTDHGLIDGYQFMVDPLALPEGIPVWNFG